MSIRSQVSAARPMAAAIRPRPASHSARRRAQIPVAPNTIMPGNIAKSHTAPPAKTRPRPALTNMAKRMAAMHADERTRKIRSEVASPRSARYRAQHIAGAALGFPAAEAGFGAYFAAPDGRDRQAPRQSQPRCVLPPGLRGNGRRNRQSVSSFSCAGRPDKPMRNSDRKLARFISRLP